MAITAVAQRSGDVSVGCAAPAPRAAYAAYGPGHSGAPLVRRPTETVDSHQDRGRGARDVVSATATESLLCPQSPQARSTSREEEPGGLRPTGLVVPRGAQERVQRHTMEQFGELAPMVQILDALVPQLVDKLEDVLKIVDLFVPVQEIEVPKISSLSCPPPRREEPQTAEQLVEVPTVLSPTRIALRIAEQIVGTPVPRGRDRRRLQGSLPRQNSTVAGDRVEQRRLLL